MRTAYEIAEYVKAKADEDSEKIGIDLDKINLGTSLVLVPVGAAAAVHGRLIAGLGASNVGAAAYGLFSLMTSGSGGTTPSSSASSSSDLPVLEFDYNKYSQAIRDRSPTFA